MSAEEILADGDMAKYAWNLNLEPTRYLGMEVGEGGVGIYFRPLASSLVDVLSAENADLKAKLAALQNLYDDASEQDMLSVSREESLTAERDALLGALAKAREALTFFTGLSVCGFDMARDLDYQKREIPPHWMLMLPMTKAETSGEAGESIQSKDEKLKSALKALESPSLPNMDGGAK